MQAVSTCLLPVAGLRWVSHLGRWSFTAVCRATISLLPGESVIAEQQEDPIEQDEHWALDATRSLSEATDLEPMKPRADVTLVGHAYAPGGTPVRSLVAHMIVGEVTKSIEVVGDRWVDQDGVLTDGPGFTSMPLVYERAAGGPGTANPAGMAQTTDRYGRVLLPNLQPVGTNVTSLDDYIAPIGFGPIAPSWPARLERVGAVSQQRSPFDLRRSPPSDLDPQFFNHAPRDQQAQVLRAGERIVLENLHPSHARLSTVLPNLRPRAALERAGRQEPIPLRCDTLTIDTDRMLCFVVWRATLPLQSPDDPGRVVFSLESERNTGSFKLSELGGATLGRTKLAAPETNEDDPLGITASGDRFFAAHDAVLPFAGSPSGVPPPPSSMPSTPPPAGGTPWHNVQAAPSAQSAGAITQPIHPGLKAAALGLSAPLPAAPLPAPPVVPIVPRRQETAEVTVPQTATPWAEVAPVAALTIGQRAALPAKPVIPVPLPSQMAPQMAPPMTPRATPSSAPEPSPSATPSTNGASSPATAEARASDPGLGPSETTAARRGAGAPQRAAPTAGAGPSLRAIQLVAYDPESLPRLRRKTEHQEILRAIEDRSFDPDLDDPNISKNPASIEDRRDVFEVIARVEPLDERGLDEAVERSVREDGKFLPPLLLVAGELRLVFDEHAALRATIALAMPFATGDEELKAAIADAKDIAAMGDDIAPAALAERFTTRILEAFRKPRGRVAPNYLDEQVARVMLEKRQYQRREVFGGKHVRALFVPEGATRAWPTYLADGMARALPLFSRFTARLMVEAHLQEDQFETHPLALRTLAVARVVSLAKPGAS